MLRATAGRPFVWFDDMDVARDVEALPPSQPWLHVEVDPVQGLTDEHVGMALQWWQQTSAAELS